MRVQRLAIVLTVINSIILLLILTQILAPGMPQAVVPVVRTHALEIVDSQGKLRAQIIVFPASVLPDGQTSQDTVIFRLIDTNGRPGVKLGTSVDGSDLLLTGDSLQPEWTGVQILAQGTGSLLKLLNRDGRVQVIQP
jgi:hypothetical protein